MLIEATVVVRARRLEGRQAIFQIIHHGLKDKWNAQVASEIRQIESTQAKDTTPKTIHSALAPICKPMHICTWHTHTLSAHWQASKAPTD